MKRLEWIDNADSYLCPVCNYETDNPNKTWGICPRCGFAGRTPPMAKLQTEFVLRTSELRPCLVGGGEEKEKALFHRWSDQAYVVHPSPLVGGHNGGQVWNVHGIVELEDGSVIEVPACNIKFLNPKHEEIAWPSMPDSK